MLCLLCWYSPSLLPGLAFQVSSNSSRWKVPKCVHPGTWLEPTALLGSPLHPHLSLPLDFMDISILPGADKASIMVSPGSSLGPPGLWLWQEAGNPDLSHHGQSIPASLAEQFGWNLGCLHQDVSCRTSKMSHPVKHLLCMPASL